VQSAAIRFLVEAVLSLGQSLTWDSVTVDRDSASVQGRFLVCLTRQCAACVFSGSYFLAERVQLAGCLGESPIIRLLLFSNR
jgi:hypothetical protein